MVFPWNRIPSLASKTLPSHTMDFIVRIPPMTIPTLMSPIFLSAWLFTSFNNSLLAGMRSLRVDLRSGSAEAYVRRRHGCVRAADFLNALKACVLALEVDILASSRCRSRTRRKCVDTSEIPTKLCNPSKNFTKTRAYEKFPGRGRCAYLSSELVGRVVRLALRKIGQKNSCDVGNCPHLDWPRLL